MTFTITGTYRGETFTVTWTDGTLSGDPDFVRLVESEAQAREGSAVGPVMGPYTTTAHLADPLSAAILLQEVFDDVTSSSGELPEPLEGEDDVIV
jgi:hypothetical protein